MNRRLKKSAMLILGAAVFVGSYTWDRQAGLDAGLISLAEARVGRPLTPVSYAGVARRTTLRVAATPAVVGTAAAVAAHPVAVAPAPVVVVAPAPAPATQTCVETVYPDGSSTRTCH